MEVRTLTRRVELFDKEVDNIKESISRIANYIIKQRGLNIEIRRVEFYNLRYGEGLGFVIVTKNYMCYDLTLERIYHHDDMYENRESYEVWYNETEYEDVKVDIEELKKLSEELKEW